MDYDAAYVKARVEDFGRILSMLPATGTRPKGYATLWPDTLREREDMFDVSDDGLKRIDHDTPVRLRPTQKQMNEFEEVMEWLSYLGQYCQRRGLIYIAHVVRDAIPRDAMTGRQYASWRKLGKKYGKSHETMRKWFDDGMQIIANHLNLLNAVDGMRFDPASPMRTYQAKVNANFSRAVDG